MSATKALTPFQAIEQAHSATYPNSATEEAAIRAVEKNVSERVQYFEGVLRQQTSDHLARTAPLRQRADALYAELSELRRQIERHGLTDELRARYLQIDDQIRQVIPSALAAMQSADAIAAKAEDPFAALNRLFEVFPALGARAGFGV